MEEGGGSEVSEQIRRVLLISAGASHSVALLSGNVVCTWGRGEDGQLGHGDAEDRPFPTQLSALDGHEIVSVTCGADHTTAYSGARMQVYSWGWGDFGRLGHGNSTDLFSPQPIKALDGLKIKQIACGDSHCLALSMEGEVLSWGRNQNGQLGIGTTEDSLVPHKIQSFQGVSIKMVAAGAEHTVAVTEDGELYGWGWGRYGNLGLGDRNDRLLPHKVSAFHTDGQIEVVNRSLENLLRCLVGNSNRNWDSILPAVQFVYNSSVNRSIGMSPFEVVHGFKPRKPLDLLPMNPHVRISEFAEAFARHVHNLHNEISKQLEGEKMVQIACGWRHTISVSSSGGLYTYGWSKYGQLGHGDFEDHLVPHKLEALHEYFISEISGGWRHTMALTSDGKLYGWGWNKFGQVGNGDNADRCSPVQIKFPNEQKVVQVSCGWRHTLAVTEKNNVFSWGRGTNGQLGHGESIDRNIPKIIDALSVDGSNEQHIASSKTYSPSGKIWVSPLEKYAVVPDETVPGRSVVSVPGNGTDASVPESDVKRVRI